MHNVTKDEKIIDYIQRKLTIDFRRRHSTIAEATGIGQSTVSRIARGETSPTLDNVQKLLDYFKEDEKLNKPIADEASGK